MSVEYSLSDPKQRELASLILAESDFKEALGHVNCVLRNDVLTTDERLDAFRAAAIIAYVRPFKKNQGYQRLPASYEEFAEGAFKKLHGELVDLRDKCIAHSDSDMNRVVRDRDPSTWKLGRPHPITFALHREGFDLFRGLCQEQLDRLKKDIETRLAQGNT